MANLTGCVVLSAEGMPHASKPCMTALPPLVVTSLTSQGSWGPTVDGVVIPADPMSMLAEGRVNGFDAAVFGAQTNDSFLFLSRQYTLHGSSQPNWRRDGDLAHLSTTEYVEALTTMVGGGARLRRAAVDLYPPLHPSPLHLSPLHPSALPQPTGPQARTDPDADLAARTYPDSIRNVQSLGRAASDQMHCAARRRAELIASAGRGRRGYVYRFNHWYQSNRACTAVPNFHLDYLGSVHQDEVTFVLGQPNFMEEGSCCGKWGLSQGQEACARSPSCVACFDESRGEGYHAYFNDEEFAFARRVGSYWTAFAAHGHPGGGTQDEAQDEAQDGAQAAGGGAVWPDITRGGVVLDAKLAGGAAHEPTLYGNPAVCQLWDEVALQV